MSKRAINLSGRLEIAVFIDFIHGYTAAIRDTQSTLQTAHALFLSGQLITPPEFGDAVKHMHCIGEYCRMFHAFIEESINLPLVVIPLRLPLLIALKNVDVQVTKLNQLFAGLREVIWTTPYPPIEQQLIVKCELEELLLSCQEVLEQAKLLLNEIRYENHRSRFGYSH